jgi:hypothetical protein
MHTGTIWWFYGRQFVIASQQGVRHEKRTIRGSTKLTFQQHSFLLGLLKIKTMSNQRPQEVSHTECRQQFR